MSAVQVLDVQPAARSRRHLHAVPSLPSPSLRRRKVFLRRRLVVAVAILLVVCGATLAARAAATGSGQPERSVIVQVQSGETLSQVAARTLPDLPISEGVLRIQHANELGSNHVDAGERLVIPAA